MASRANAATGRTATRTHATIVPAALAEQTPLTMAIQRTVTTAATIAATFRLVATTFATNAIEAEAGAVTGAATPVAMSLAAATKTATKAALLPIQHRHPRHHRHRSLAALPSLSARAHSPGPSIASVRTPSPRVAALSPSLSMALHPTASARRTGLTVGSRAPLPSAPTASMAGASIRYYSLAVKLQRTRTSTVCPHGSTSRAQSILSLLPEGAKR